MARSDIRHDSARDAALGTGGATGQDPTKTYSAPHCAGTEGLGAFHVLIIITGAFDLDMVLHCKWFMLPMTLDMPDEGTR